MTEFERSERGMMWLGKIGDIINSCENEEQLTITESWAIKLFPALEYKFRELSHSRFLELVASSKIDPAAYEQDPVFASDDELDINSWEHSMDKHKWYRENELTD